MVVGTKRASRRLPRPPPSRARVVAIEPKTEKRLARERAYALQGVFAAIRNRAKASAHKANMAYRVHAEMIRCHERAERVETQSTDEWIAELSAAEN